MSLLTNIKTPTSPVLLCIHPDGKVFAAPEGGRREHTAVPVPPHGDLIDRDALIAAICSRLCIRSTEYLLPAEAVIVNEIYESLTIIPASDKDINVLCCRSRMTDWIRSDDLLPPLRHRMELDGEVWHESDPCLLYGLTPGGIRTFGVGVLVEGTWSGTFYGDWDASRVEVIAWQVLAAPQEQLQLQEE